MVGRIESHLYGRLRGMHGLTLDRIKLFSVSLANGHAG